MAWSAGNSPCGLNFAAVDCNTFFYLPNGWVLKPTNCGDSNFGLVQSDNSPFCKLNSDRSLVVGCDIDGKGKPQYYVNAE